MDWVTLSILESFQLYSLRKVSKIGWYISRRCSSTMWINFIYFTNNNKWLWSDSQIIIFFPKSWNLESVSKMLLIHHLFYKALNSSREMFSKLTGLETTFNILNIIASYYVIHKKKMFKWKYLRWNMNIFL